MRYKIGCVGSLFGYSLTTYGYSFFFFQYRPFERLTIFVATLLGFHDSMLISSREYEPKQPSRVLHLDKW